jgi:hypothetical protein
MNRSGFENISMFIGPEVEHTPAYSKRTLFVVGRQGVADIIKQAQDNKVTHIFMGANHSFDIDPKHPDETVKAYWDKTITALLDKGFWVTLDYEAHLHEMVLKMLNPGIWQSRIFVPLLSVRIPNIETSSNNLTVKIDDIDFKATNRGVWCMHFHEVTDSNRFTDWQDYESDSVISKISIPAKNEPAPKPTQVKLVVEDAISATLQSVSTEPLNQPELGLDDKPTTALKPEEDSTTIVVNTPEDAAAAYADGTTTDPLSAENSKKPKAAKK